jgi:mRNA-degrading endonuclease RelE of RelBE toxin-antitoxin system
MAYTVVIERRAQKDFLKLSAPHDGMLKRAIDGLERDPRPQGVRKLVGAKGG